MIHLLVSRLSRLSHLRSNTMASAKIKPNRSDAVFDIVEKRFTLHEIAPSILYIDSDFCVINKPANVRMTGNFPVTVEKLLLHWLPGIEVKSLKWIHQLDYATSGVLCVGLNRKAAAIASSSFELRDVKKQYLAVLQGHLNINDFPLMVEKVTSFSPLEASVFEANSSSTLHKRKLTEGDSSAGVVSESTLPILQHVTSQILPNEPVGAEAAVEAPSSPHAVSSSTWQTEVMEANLQLHYRAFTEWKAANCDSVLQGGAANENRDNDGATFHHFQQSQPEKWNMLQKIASFSYDQFQRNPKHRKALRKFLKSCGIEPETKLSTHTSCLELFSTQERLKEKLADSTETNFEVTPQAVSVLSAYYKKFSYGQPRVYRMPVAETEGNRSSNSCCIEKLLIHIPVAEIPGDFRMEPGHVGNPGKDCETELEILEYGTYKGMDVTKVRLYPRTGRRHQLRIHCLCLGHPIVGDYTYNPAHRDNVILAQNGGSPSALDATADRMMLHAHRLRVAYPSIGKLELAAPTGNQEVRTIVDTFLASPAAVQTGTATNLAWTVDWTGDLSVHHSNVVASGTVTDNVPVGAGKVSILASSEGTTSVAEGTRDQRSAIKGGNQGVLVAAEAPDPFVFMNSVLQL